MASLGFEYQQTLRGTFDEVASEAPSRSMTLCLVVRCSNVLELLRTRELAAEGTLAVDGFADEVPIAGRLTVAPVEGRLGYELPFVANDGRAYHVTGETMFRSDSPMSSATTVLGEVRDGDGSAVGRFSLAFDVKTDLLPTLVSLRPLWRR